MYVICDDYCNTYTLCSGRLEVYRSGSATVFASKEEVETALARYVEENRPLRPIWYEEL